MSSQLFSYDLKYHMNNKNIKKKIKSEMIWVLDSC